MEDLSHIPRNIPFGLLNKFVGVSNSWFVIILSECLNGKPKYTYGDRAGVENTNTVVGYNCAQTIYMVVRKAWGDDSSETYEQCKGLYVP